MDNKLLKDPILLCIKKELFQGLPTYKKKFSDFVIPPFFSLRGSVTTKNFWTYTKKALSEIKEILLYIHFPFCNVQCIFCDTAPFKTRSKVQKRYVDCLIKEIMLTRKTGLLEGKKVKAVYFGGGTPTDMGVGDLKKIFGSIRQNFILTKGCNITCESHPKNIIGKHGKNILDTLCEEGVNRISIGIQSFDEKVLSICKRGHTAKQAIEASENLKAYKISNNIDMMIGLPAQTLESVKRDLEILETIRPDAIEYMRHEIINHQAIRLYKKYPEYKIDHDTLFNMVLTTQKWMWDNNYEQNGYLSKESRFFPYRYHWVKEMPYWAFGSRANSHLGRICFYKNLDRYEKLRIYFNYIENDLIPVRGYKIYNKKERMYRALFMNIQTKEGLSIKNFKLRFGYNPRDVLQNAIDKLISFGLIEEKGGFIRPTKYGGFFMEDISCFIKKLAIEDISSNNNISIPRKREIEYKKKNPKVSVIVPTFNRKKMLELTLSVLLNQDYPKDKYELIIVDDGSNDGTRDLINNLVKHYPNIRYFFQNTIGFEVAKARNLGAKYANGDILIFLNDDIIAFPDLISNHVKALLNGHDVILGYTAGYYTDAKYNYEELKDKIKLGDIKNIHLIKEFRNNLFMDPKLNNSFNNKGIWKYFVATNFSMYRDIFIKEKFHESFLGWGAEDEEFGYRLVKNGYKIAMAKECIGLHVSHQEEEGLIGVYNKKKVTTLLGNLIRFFKIHPISEVEEYIKKRYFGLPAEFKNFRNYSYLVEAIQKIKEKKD